MKNFKLSFTGHVILTEQEYRDFREYMADEELPQNPTAQDIVDDIREVSSATELIGELSLDQWAELEIEETDEEQSVEAPQLVNGGVKAIATDPSISRGRKRKAS